MRRLPVLLLLAPVVALASSPVSFTTWSSPASFAGGVSTAALRLPFLTPGCYPSGSAVGTKGEAITVTRASTATYEDCSGVIQTCAAGQARVGCQGGQVAGLLVERASTQYVVNPGTHPKADEATNALGTGAHVAWHRGTGTMTVAAGTAVVTGLSCTAVAAGTVCAFNVTTGGTMLVTTTAGTTHAQVEPGASRTSDILAAATRNADVVTVPTPAGLDPARWCVEVTATPYGGRAWGTPTGGLWSIGTGANSTYLNQGFFSTADAANATKYLGPYSAPSSAAHRMTAANSAGTLALKIDGTLQSLSPVGAGSGALAALQTPINLGLATFLEWNGYLRDFRVYRSPSCR